MFDTKLSKALKALKGKEAADVTAEEMDALNAELSAEGVTGFMVVAQGSIEAFAKQATAEAQTTIERLTAELATATESNTAHTATIATHEARIAELEAIVPGGKDTKIKTDGDDAHESNEDKEKYITTLDREAAARKEKNK